MHPEPARPDPNVLFREFLSSAGAADRSDPLLNTLVVDVAQPLVRRVIGRRVGSVRGINAQDIDDVCSDAMAALMGRLRVFRETPDAVAIGDFESWVAGLAGHTAFQFLARRFPDRSRLRSRIRYALTTDARAGIRQADHGASVCFAAGGEARPPASPADIERARQSTAATLRLPDLIVAILQNIKGTIELGDLTSVVASVLGVEESAESASIEFPERIADPGAPHSRQLESRDWLQRLWKELVMLPLAQRIALLLNLRSAAGPGLWLLVDLRIASFRELAGTLEMAAETLAELWNHLPLEDREIAERWGWKRQQVINLRSAARQRLTRRMRNIEQIVSDSNIMGDSTTN